MHERLSMDTRSCRLARTTGWERYARGMQAALDQQLPAGLTAMSGRANPFRKQFIADWWILPRATRGQTVFFPSYPPTPATIALADRVLYTLHDLTWWRYPETASRGGRLYYKRWAEAALARVDVVLTDSQAMREELLASRLVRSGTHVAVTYPAPLGPIDGDCRQGATNSGQQPYLLAVGTLEPRKNLLRLFRAYALAGLYPDVALVIVGRVGWGSVEPVAGVTVRSDVTDDELSSLYREAVGVVAPSLYEGFGLPLAEALVHGTALACSDTDVFREVSGGHAIFFDPTDIEDMAEALRRLAEGPRAGEQARSHAAQFTWAAAASVVVEAAGFAR